MEKILNRITWILSFVLASVIVFGFSGLYRDFWYYFFGAFWGYWFAILIL
jgi:hypothetical protein